MAKLKYSKGVTRLAKQMLKKLRLPGKKSQNMIKMLEKFDL